MTETGIVEARMGLMFYLMLFVAMCVFGWMVRGNAG